MCVCVCVCAFSFVQVYTWTQICLPSRLVLQNTPTAFLQIGKTPSTNVLDMTLNKYDGEVPVMLELWGMWSTPSLSSVLVCEPQERI